MRHATGTYSQVRLFSRICLLTSGIRQIMTCGWNRKGFRVMGSFRLSVAESVSRREILTVSGVALILAVYTFLVHPQSPVVVAADQDWYGWYDQGQYVSIARILADFALPDGPENYTYGLGYPLLAVLFIWLGFDADPFIVPDILLVSGTVALTYVFAVRVSSRAVAALAVLLLLIATPIIRLAVEPWSSTVSGFCIAAALVVATSPRGLTTRNALILGGLSAWAFSARFVDVVPIIAIALWAAFSSPRGRRLRMLAVGGGVAFTGFVLVLITQWVSLGSPFVTPYASHLRPDGVNDQSLGQYQLGRIGQHFWETFVTGTANGVPTGVWPLLLASPFLVLAPVGFALVVRRGVDRGLHITLFSVAVVMGTVYLSFVAGGGQDLVYRNVRYWLPYFYYGAVLAAVAICAGYAWMISRSVGGEPATENPAIDRPATTARLSTSDTHHDPLVRDDPRTFASEKSIDPPSV